MALLGSRRIVMFFGLVSAVVLLGAACSGNGHRSASGIDITSHPSQRGTSASTTTSSKTGMSAPAPSTSAPSTTTTVEPDSPDSGPDGSLPSTPDLTQRLNSLLGTIESACSHSGLASSTCVCVTKRFRSEDTTDQGVAELASRLAKVMRDCMNPH
jgi:hypothetical protein